MKNTTKYAAILRARLLPLILTLALLTACVKAGDTRDAPTPVETPESPAAATTSMADSRETDAYTLPEPKNYTGEIDVDDVMSKMYILAKYINHPILSQSEPEQLDLLYFAIEYIHYGPSIEALDLEGFLETGPEISVSSKTLADCLYAVFGLGPDYLDSEIA